MEWERIWFGDGTVARAVRGALRPLSALYTGGVAFRNTLYDRGVLRVHQAPLPAVSVGNLGVGGAGKTPLAAWFAGRLREHGARPAIVLRGYGGDEPDVHRTLNPGVMVIADPDRHRGASQARAQGCDVVVYDDAFQHRRAARLVDVVLVNADRWPDVPRMLPAGPWREPTASLRRATLVIVTRKTSDGDWARALAERLAPLTASGQAAVVALTPSALHRVGGSETVALDSIRERRVLAIAGIAHPGAFGAQLTGAGAEVELAAHPDHHRFTAADIERLVTRAAAADLVVCTLKDAVKLRDQWPRAAPPLWYVSLRCEPEAGAEALEGLLRRLLAARNP